MKIYDRAELRGQLFAHADELYGRWYFRDGGEHGRTEHGHTEEDALKIVESCLYLGTKITDRVTVSAWTALIEKIRELENRS